MPAAELTPEDIFDVRRRFKYLHLLLNIGSKGAIKLMTKMNVDMALGSAESGKGVTDFQGY